MSLTLKDQLLRKCIHFNGVMEKTCRAGVAYKDVRFGKPYNFPCLQHGGECAHSKFMTEDEASEKAKQIKEGSTKTIIAMLTIKQHYDTTKEREGSIDCQCGGKLSYTIAKTNGHIWAKCDSCDVCFTQ